MKNTYNKHRPLTNTVLWIESYKLIIVHWCNTQNVKVTILNLATDLNSSTNPCIVYPEICNEDEDCDISKGYAACVNK